MYKLKNVNKLTFILISVVLLFSSCSITKPKVIKVKEKYSITIPYNFTQSNNINSEASLQYTDARKDFFVIVIDESQEEFKKALVDNNLIEQYPNNLEGYAGLLLLSMKQNFKYGKISEMKDIKINNMNAKIAEVNEKVSGFDIYYNIALVKGKKTFYQILTWTRSKRKIECKKEMDMMINSFKEL
ncbi:hypothetical protein E0494_09190 [Marinilabiliaceae bacterium JC040]|nr:hypothetical protein [Marinilabiliaceae bacterium JC040]